MKTSEIFCDVLVVGAGISGVAAAVASSGRGARTVLLEQDRFLGGAVIAGMHRYLCGLYGNTVLKTINPGMARELVYGLRRLSRHNKARALGKVHVLAFRSRDLKSWLEAKVRGKRNLTVIVKSRVYKVIQSRGTIRRVYAKCNGARVIIFPGIVIDASGQGVVIRLSRAGHREVPLKKRQLAGYSFRVKGVKDTDGLLAVKVPYYSKLSTYTPLDALGEGIIRLNIASSDNLTAPRNEARKVFRYLQKFIPELRRACIAEYAGHTVEREGVRLQGEYTLTAGDILRGRKFKDPAAKGAWPIELWCRGKGPQYNYLPRGSYYEIPRRCLRAKRIRNLLAAGRCISVSHQALGSTRVAGTCITLGEQAGIIAGELMRTRLVKPILQ